MRTPDNKIASTFYLLFTTLVVLTLASRWLPSDMFTAWNLKKVDYIEPLVLKAEKKKKPNKNEHAKIQVAVAKDSQQITIKDTTQRPAIVYDFTTIEDYSDKGAQTQLFLEALHNAKNNNCRIAFYGDSFIEGDIMTMNLRDSLQKHFGGRGIGFLPLSSEVSMFRKSMPSESEDWEVYSIAKQSKREAFGIAGVTFIPQRNAAVKLLPPRAIGNVHLLYKNLGKDVKIKTLVNKKHQKIDTLKNSDALAVQALVQGKDTVKHLKISIEGENTLKIYGLSLEGNKGVYLDNFSIRGNSGLGLNDISDQQFSDFQSLMNYKLVVLQFGINVSNAETTDFGFYERAMVKMIRRMKRIFPQTSFLLLSISDRSHKEDGVYVTMPSIPLLVESQRTIAQESGILFWDMYSAMGGENSMVTWVEEKKANKDYTHLTFSGGRQVASALFKAILHEYKSKKNEGITLATP